MRCAACGEEIEYWPGDDGPPGYYDPNVHDLDSPGNRCPVGIEHSPN